MLVLSRKNGESILISQGIEVKVLSIRGSTVKLGLSAPSDVHIRRREIPRQNGSRSALLVANDAGAALCPVGAR
jgi:carbon storage regulator